jgi:hypothetical protein
MPMGQSESVDRRTDNTMTKRKCRKGQTMIYKIYTGLNYVYLKWSSGLPNFGGGFGDQNLNLVNSGWSPEILDNFPSLIRF